MEEALVLGALAFSFPRDLINKMKRIPGVTDANFVYGPYDFYAMVKTDTKEELRDAVAQIRSIEGVQSPMTCNVVSMQPRRGSAKE